MIIGLVGEKLAGKDTIANYLVQKHGADHVRFTHVLDEILNTLNLPISRRNEIDLGLGLRKIFGHGVLARAVTNRVNQSKKYLVVVNGIRMDEMKDIKNLNASIIYVTAPAEIRFERYKNRHEKSDDGVMDFEQFKEQENEQTEVGIPELGKQADYKIENAGTVAELYEKVEVIINSMTKIKKTK